MLVYKGSKEFDKYRNNFARAMKVSCYWSDNQDGKMMMTSLLISNNVVAVGSDSKQRSSSGSINSLIRSSCNLTSLLYSAGCL